MSKQLLTEFFELCPDGRCLDRLSESQKREVIQEGAVYLVGRIQTADKKNGNGRVYPQKVLKKEINNYQKIIRDGRATGELDHPDDSVINSSIAAKTTFLNLFLFLNILTANLRIFSLYDPTYFSPPVSLVTPNSVTTASSNHSFDAFLISAYSMGPISNFKRFFAAFVIVS